jgi:hypothetical protein
MAGEIDLSIDYEAVMEVSRVFGVANANFASMVGPFNDAAARLAQQVFVGDTGNAELNALQQVILNFTNELALKCNEMKGDLDKAIQDYQNADNSSMQGLGS